MLYRFSILMVAIAIMFTTHRMMAQTEDVLRPKGRTAYEVSQNSSSRANSDAKTPIRFGIELGANYNMAGATYSGSGISQGLIDAASTYNGVAPFINVFADIGITNNLGIWLQVGYEDKSTSRNVDYKDECTIYDVNTGLPISSTAATINYNGTTDLTYFSIGAQLRYNLNPNLFILAGPTFQFLNSNSFSSSVTQTIKDPVDCFFNYGTPEQSKVDVVKNTDARNLLTTRVGLNLGVGYMFPINNSLSIAPKLGYQLMFSNVERDITNSIVNSANSYLNSIQLGVALLFSPL
jgi:hypothetical protein